MLDVLLDVLLDALLDVVLLAQAAIAKTLDNKIICLIFIIKLRVDEKKIPPTPHAGCLKTAIIKRMLQRVIPLNLNLLVARLLFRAFHKP